jgi:perosamine synthetase
MFGIAGQSTIGKRYAQHNVIPLSRSRLGPEEAAAVTRVLESGRLVQGERVTEFEVMAAARTGRSFAIAVSSGTAALRLALEALGVGRGSQVLVPDLTWPSPGHAALELGAEVGLVEVDAREWTTSPQLMAAGIGPHTAAAIAIDQFGCPARSQEIGAALAGIPLIVDAACSLGSHTGERPCGALGTIACLSFHPRKLVTTGEGGMCLTDDPALAERLRELRNHGQRAPGVFGRASGNHRLSEIAAAIGCIQLGRLDDMLVQRRQLAERYTAALPELVSQAAPAGASRNFQTYGVLLPERHRRDDVIAALRQREIEAGRLSYALHTLPQFGAAAASARAVGRSFPNATALAERGIALPLWPGLSESEQARVIDGVRAVLA